MKLLLKWKVKKKKKKIVKRPNPNQVLRIQAQILKVQVNLDRVLLNLVLQFQIIVIKKIWIKKPVNN